MNHNKFKHKTPCFVDLLDKERELKDALKKNACNTLKYLQAFNKLCDFRNANGLVSTR